MSTQMLSGQISCSNLHLVQWYSSEWRMEIWVAYMQTALTVSIFVTNFFIDVYVNCKNELVAYSNHLIASFIVHSTRSLYIRPLCQPFLHHCMCPKMLDSKTVRDLTSWLLSNTVTGESAGGIITTTVAISQLRCFAWNCAIIYKFILKLRNWHVLPAQPTTTVRDQESRYRCQTLCTAVPVWHRLHTDLS